MSRHFVTQPSLLGGFCLGIFDLPPPKQHCPSKSSLGNWPGWCLAAAFVYTGQFSFARSERLRLTLQPSDAAVGHGQQHSGSLATLYLFQFHLTAARLPGNKLKQTSKMTAFSIFNDCTIEDINQHLFALAAGSRHALLPKVEVSPSRVRMKITVDEVRGPGQTTKTSVQDYRLPGERVTGDLSIESKDPITLAHARIRLDGKTTLTLGS